MGVVRPCCSLGAIRSLLQLNSFTANELTIVTGSLLLLSVVIPVVAARLGGLRRTHRHPDDRSGTSETASIGTDEQPLDQFRGQPTRRTDHACTTQRFAGDRRRARFTAESAMRTTLVRVTIAAAALATRRRAPAPIRERTRAQRRSIGRRRYQDRPEDRGDPQVDQQRLLRRRVRRREEGVRRSSRPTCEQVGPTRGHRRRPDRVHQHRDPEGLSTRSSSRPPTPTRSRLPCSRPRPQASRSSPTTPTSTTRRRALAMIKPTTPDLIAHVAGQVDL